MVVAFDNRLQSGSFAKLDGNHIYVNVNRKHLEMMTSVTSSYPVTSKKFEFQYGDALIVIILSTSYEHRYKLYFPHANSDFM